MDGNAQVISQAEALLAELPAITRPVVARYFRQHFKVDLKSDNSPVTIADKLVEAEIRQAITSAFSSPDMACDIIGEEQGGEANSRYCWVIDRLTAPALLLWAGPYLARWSPLLITGRRWQG